MSTRDRKKAAKRRRLERARQGEPVVKENLPRPLRLVAEGMEEMRGYVQAANSPQEAEALARERIVTAARRLAELTAPYDAFDVLELVRLSHATGDPETYKETEHEGRAASIEVVAAVLAARGSRLPVRDDGTATATTERARPDPVMDEVLRIAEELSDAGSMLAMFAAMAEPDALSTISLGAVLREVGVRNLAYPHMVDDTVAALFDPPEIATDVRHLLGCDVADIRAVFSALTELHEQAWNSRFDAMREFGTFAHETMSGASPLTEETRARGRALWNSVWDQPGDCSIITDGELAEAAQRPIDVIKAVRRAFSTPMAVGSADEAALTFLEGRASFRVRPILSDPNGDMVVIHGGLLTAAIRERVEEALKTDSAAWARYDKHRAQHLESVALELLGRHLPGASRHEGLEYLVPASEAEARPQDYTKLGETDGLLVVDDVAIVVEGKAGALRPLSRTGHRIQLVRDLRGLVTSAAEQGNRVRTRVLNDGGLMLRNGTWLDLSNVREVHTVAVSLDDLSGIATVTTMLVHAGLLPDEHLPWTVSLHDLRIISELVERPAELLLYLRRRGESSVTRFFHAVDELDFFLHFYQTGLYVYPDPDVTAQMLPHLPPPSVADRRRHAAQRLTFLTSRTDVLDAWYFYQLGVRTTPAPKPTLNANRALLELVDAVAAQERPGWLSMGTNLLEGDSATQRKWGDYGRRLCEISRKDGQPHTIAVPGGTRPEGTFLVVWASRPDDQPVEVARERLSLYISAKKHQLRAARGFGILFDASTGVLHSTVFDNRVTGPDAALDALGQEMNLRPPEQMRELPLPKTAPRKAGKRKGRRR